MKIVLTLLLAMSGAAPLLAQNYQYQYPYDPYSSAPKPQPTASSSAASSTYAKLLTYGSLSLNYSFLDFHAESLPVRSAYTDPGHNRFSVWLTANGGRY